MLTHCEDTLVKHATAGEPPEALGLEHPTLTSLNFLMCRDERRESTSAPRPFCLFTFRITPCSSWTVFQCVLFCVLSNRVSMRVVSGHV